MSTQKTVIIWDTCNEDMIRYFVAEGDLRHLNNCYIGGLLDSKVEDELAALLPTSEQLSEEFPTTAVLEGAFVIVCGIIP